MGQYSIRDLEKLSGVKAHTLRIWEQRYGILKPERSCTNIRSYTDEDLKTLLNISLLNAKGIKISKLAEMSGAELQKEVISLWECCEEFESQVNALTLAMIDLDEARFEKMISRSFLQFGYESTMLNVIYPFFRKIGLMWQACSINPAQEHFISNLIRQKMIVAIDGLPISTDTGKDLFLFFLPEGEYHEIGLLMGHYLVRSRGYRTVYLGHSVPHEDLLSTVKTYSPRYLFSILTGGWQPDDAEKFIRKTCEAIPGSTLLISGPVTQSLPDDLPQNLKILEGIPELSAFLKH